MARLLSILVLVLLLSGCGFSGQNIYIDGDDDQDIDIDAYYYAENFIKFLNNDSDTDVLILSENILNIKQNDDIQNRTEFTSSDTPDDVNEIDKYAIIDYFGYISGYGTEEESISSMAVYDNTDVYTLMNTDLIANRLRLKVYNKQLQHSQLFVLDIIGNIIESYTIYD